MADNIARQALINRARKNNHYLRRGLISWADWAEEVRHIQAYAWHVVG